MKALLIKLTTTNGIEEHVYEQRPKSSSRIKSKETYPNENMSKIVNLFCEAREEMTRINSNPNEIDEVGYAAELCLSGYNGSDHKISIRTTCARNEKLNHIFKEIIKIIMPLKSPISDTVLDWNGDE